MKPTNKSDRSNRNRQAIAGVRKHYASTASMVLDGVSYAPTDVERALQGSIDAADATTAATALFHKTVDAERTANATADTVYAGLKAFVTTQFKAAPDVLADFGFTLPSRQVPDAATVATAVEKRNATRVARHTMGKRQKAKVTGATSAATTPPAAAPAPSPAVAPKPTSG
ncbi:MAG TPA: hypothetical protein VK762_38515 [Polyangiaceae bacterium]|jgi:hypothetical protein|nr:hypothetical protein [Polyangiaceae bacterium]